MQPPGGVKRRGLALLLYSGLSVTLIGCAAAGTDSSSEEVTPPPPRTTTPSLTTPANNAACPVDALTDIVKNNLSMAPGVSVGGVEVTNCRNQYARIVIDPSPPGAADPLFGFLQRKNEQWQVINIGGDLDCDVPDLTPAVVEACRQLGLL